MSNENIAMENEALEAAEAAEAAEAVEVTAEAETAEVTEAAEPVTAEEEIEEPKIMLFLDEDEEDEETEEYTPKVVAYQETVEAKNEPEKEKTPEQLKLEEEINNEKFIRDEIAWMFERKLFNVPAWLSLVFIFGAFPAIFTGLYLSEIMGGVNLSIVEPEMTGLSVIAVAFMQVLFGILSFIAMRIIVTAARNSGGNMSTAGFSMLRTVVLLMCAEPVIMFLDLPGTASGIIGTVALIFLLILLISIHKVRSALIKGKVKMISPLCGTMFFVMAAMHAAPLYIYICDIGASGADMFDSLKYVVYFTLSMIATVLFGIFAHAFNKHMKKVKAAVEAE